MHLYIEVSKRITCIALFSLLITVNVIATDWPQWRGPDGNGISTETTLNPQSLKNGASIVWKAQIGIGYSSVAIADGIVYGMGNKGNKDTVYAIDAVTGREMWSYSYRCALGGYPGPRATPAVRDGRVYTLSREGHVFCFDASSGEVLFKKHLVDDFRMSSPNWGFAGSPVVFENLVLFNAGKSGIALNRISGDSVWVSERGRGSYAAPVLYPYRGGMAAAIFGERAIYGVDVLSGQRLWSHPWSTSPSVNAADPVVKGSRVFVASAYGKGSGVIDFSERNTKSIWTSPLFNTHFSSFILDDGYIYGNDGDARQSTSGTFRCIDMDSGDVLWSERSGFGSLIAVGPYLVTLNFKGIISVVDIDPDGYTLRASAPLPRGQFWSSPAYSNGFLYCRDIKGNLYRIDMR